MGFLSKLGNVLEDGASFAVPAAASAGLTLLSGGTLNPATQGGLLALLGSAGAGAKGFAGNEQQERLRKMQKEQNRNNAMANLINTLSPRANYQPNQAKTPKAGMLETVATGAGQGIDAFQMAMQAQQMAERAAMERKRLGLEIDAAERAADMAVGVDKASSRAAMDQQRSDRLTGLVEGTKPGTPMKQAGQAMLNATPSQSFGGWGGADSLRREMSTPTTGAQQTGFNQFMQGRDDDRFDKVLDVEELDLKRQTQRSTDEERRKSWEAARLGQLGSSGPDPKRLSTLMQDAVANVEEMGVDGALDLFKQQARNERFSLTEGDYENFYKTLSKAEPDFELPVGLIPEVARRAALEDGIQSIRQVVAGLSDDEFGTWASMWNEFAADFRQGRLAEPELLNLMNQVGLTTEMALRMFSGAAITAEEFDRFSNNFIGGLRGGKSALLSRLNTLETEFRTQRTKLIGTAQNPTAPAGIGAISDEEVVNLAIAGDPAAEAELENRPSAARLLESMLTQ